MRQQGDTLCIAYQNLIEFWAVATRPRTQNGLGMTLDLAEKELANLRRLFNLLPPVLDALDNWQRIVIAYGVLGKKSHDAHVVAVMQVYSVTNILTFNGSDFRRFPGLTVLDPAQF